MTDCHYVAMVAITKQQCTLNLIWNIEKFSFVNNFTMANIGNKIESNKALSNEIVRKFLRSCLGNLSISYSDSAKFKHPQNSNCLAVYRVFEELLHTRAWSNTFLIHAYNHGSLQFQMGDFMLISERFGLVFVVMSEGKPNECQRATLHRNWQRIIELRESVESQLARDLTNSGNEYSITKETLSYYCSGIQSKSVSLHIDAKSFDEAPCSNQLCSVCSDNSKSVPFWYSYLVSESKHLKRSLTTFIHSSSSFGYEFSNNSKCYLLFLQK